MIFFFCEVFKGYFSFVFAASCPGGVIHGVADNDFTKSVERVLDMLLIFFCTGHRNSPYPQRLVHGWRAVFMINRGRQHSLLSPLDNVLRQLSADEYETKKAPL